MTFEREQEVAVATAREAATLIRRHAGNVAHADVREKNEHDLVTQMDEAAQRLIVGRLTDAFPSYDVLAEEGADLAASAPVAEGCRWIIDPIDGTTNFTHGVPPYAVSIGLQCEAKMVVGVVLDAARDELFTARRGGGLFVDGRSARVSYTQTLYESLLTTGFPYRAFDHLDAYLDVLRRFMKVSRGLRRPGSASVDLAYVACGRFDGFFETGLHPWDVAAGSLLVEEGGGRVSDYRDSPDCLFAQQILASNGLIHAAMLEQLSGMRDARS